MQTIYDHIKKRVSELGYTDFSVQPVFIATDKKVLEYEIKAYNELYFLMGQIPVGTRIISDTCAMKTESNFNDLEIKPYYEFSGFIEITLQRATKDAIGFLKVILS